MDLLLACEDLTSNIVDNIDDTEPVADQDIEKWQQLFGFATRVEASNAILEWRGDLGRKTLSPESWAMIKDEFESSGYDRGLRVSSGFSEIPPPSYSARLEATRYFLYWRFNPPLKARRSNPGCKNSPTIAGLSCTPKVIHGTQEDDDDHSPDSNSNSSLSSPPPGTSIFCLIDGHTKAKLLQAFSSPSTKITMADFRPTFIKTAQMAKKDISAYSLYPTLSIDTTLPQFRSQPLSLLSQENPCNFSSPSQDEYPVWYFFYGTLADSNVLARVLGRDGDSPTTISYRKARLRSTVGIDNADWRITTWGGKYRALVDFPSSSMVSGEGSGNSVEGTAYLVKNREEDAPRYYETDRYEAVRCGIEFLDGEQQHAPQWIYGLKFMFIG